MKYTARIVMLLLVAVMLIPTFAACTNNTDDPLSVSTDNLTMPSESAESSADTIDDKENFIFEIVYPSISVSSLKFNLTDKKLAEYNDKLDEAKLLFNKDEKGSEDIFTNALYEVLSLRAEIQTQCDIAYLQYCYDMSDDTAWDNYLYAYRLHDEAADLFWGFYNTSKNVTNNLSTVFKEVVWEEYKGHTVMRISSADDYAYDMELLEEEYNSLINSNASDDEIFEVYKKYIIAANGLAVASSAENYYEYACKHIFYRNDTTAQREQLRKYTKEYLVPIYRELKTKSKQIDSSLSSFEYSLSDKYLFDKYDSFDEDYLFDYFSSLAPSSCEAMMEAFEKDRVLIGNTKNSYNNAMVYCVGNTPICYFHKDKTALDVMAHELGHYYTNFVGDSNSAYYSYDLDETHSTANAMLLYSYLSNKIDSRAFKGAEIYKMYEWMYQIILSVIKDEFDEIIYTGDPSTLTLEDFERIMSDLIDEYNARDLSNNMVSQLMTYWRRLGIKYSVKNYCYATAKIASFQIYIKSKYDYAAAVEIYRKVVEEPQNDGDFVSTVVGAGLTTPYEEQTYIELKKLTEIY